VRAATAGEANPTPTSKTTCQSKRDFVIYHIYYLNISLFYFGYNVSYAKFDLSVTNESNVRILGDTTTDAFGVDHKRGGGDLGGRRTEGPRGDPTAFGWRVGRPARRPAIGTWGNEKGG